MNIFMPYEDITKSVRALDDKRLNKQILECYQILQVALGNSHGYENHPVVRHYVRYPICCELYALDCCIEYMFRFGVQHKYSNFFEGVSYEELISNKNRYPFCDTFLYAEYQAFDPRCIREIDTERVTALFRDKLVRKWKQDIKNGRPPKWTNRGAPEFWEETI